MITMEDVPKSPKSVRSWKSFGSRKGSKIYVEEDLVNDQKQIDELQLLQLPPKLDIFNPELLGQNTPQSQQDSQSRGIDRGKLLQPPKTPPKLSECFLSSEGKIDVDRIPFDKEYSVELAVEEAVGLPLTVAATRIHARLHMPTRNDVRNVSEFAYGELLSDHTAPKFVFSTRYKGKMLHQTMTIIVRLDGLEVPSLTPKIIGFAAVRLCVNRIGMQPLSEILSDGKPSCYYNTGEFTIPILYGTFPNVPFVTETKFHECLPHIDGAYLKVKLLAIKEKDTNNQSLLSINQNPLPSSPTRISLLRRTSSYRSVNSSRHSLLSSTGSQQSIPGSIKGRNNSSAGTLDKAISIRSLPEQVHLSAKTIVSMVLKTYLSRNHNTTMENSPSGIDFLSLQDSVLQLFLQGEWMDSMTRQTVALTVNVYITTIFESQPDPQEALSSQYLLPYKEECGCMAKLDVLYNMPDRKKLIQSAERAASVAAMRTGLSRKWDNKINFFKTVFRYLPGSLQEEDLQAQFMLNSQASHDGAGRDYTEKTPKAFDTPPMQELIIDDASVKPSLLSTETCPVYLDEFSCTANIRLGRKACLLVIVTAVDVLTTKKGGQDNSTFHPTTPTLEPSPSNMNLLSPVGSSRMSFSDNEGASSPTAKGQKLKGLLGVYVGRDDPRATWWGLVPLFAKNPMISSSGAFASQSNGAHSSFLFANTNANMNSSPNPYTSSFDPNFSSNPNPNPNLPPSLSLAPLQIPCSSSATSMLSLTSFPLFVNEGTHQIPLFQGVPPQEMITSPDPMSWVMRRLQQQSGKPVTTRSSLTSIAEFFMSPLVIAGLYTPRASSFNTNPDEQDRAVTPSFASSRKSKKRKSKIKTSSEDLVLSPGCSAFVRIVDPRMKRVGGYSIVEDSQKQCLQDHLTEILALQSQYAVDGSPDAGANIPVINNANSNSSGNGVPATPTSTASPAAQYAIDNYKLKTLKSEFAYVPNKLLTKRALKTAIPESIDPNFLFQEVTEKFYQALATGGR